MPSILVYVLAAGVGVMIAHFISRAPELRSMRLSQLIFVPVCLVLGVYFLRDGTESSSVESTRQAYGVAIEEVIRFAVVAVFLALLLAPNIGYLCGSALTNFLDPNDWTPDEEEIALRPIRRLIDKDRYHQALTELDHLLQTHKPTYEACLLKTKLLHHCGQLNDSVAALLSLIELSQTTAQQLAAMELLALLEEYHQDPPKTPASGPRRIQIRHELVLFQMSGNEASLHKEIPPGTYEVEETVHRNHRWLKLAGEDWGNAEMCWEAILAIHRSAVAPPKKGLFWRVARMHQAVSTAIKGKPHFQRQTEAQALFHEAQQLIRRHDWQGARLLLQKASACDPGRYEIAYRWVQAVRQTGSDDDAAKAVSQVLEQSQWTENEEQMLKQLQRPIAKSVL